MKHKIQQKTVTVKEIKALEPKADVHQLKDNSVYLIVVQPPKIKLVGSNPNAAIEGGSALVKMLDERGVKALLVTMDFKDEIQILELNQRLESDR